MWCMLQEIVMAEQRNKVISKLHGILRPFVLRRLKADVQVRGCGVTSVCGEGGWAQQM